MAIIKFSFVSYNMKGFQSGLVMARDLSMDWFQGFVHRRCEISLCTTEPTSVSWASSFNKHNVSEFFSIC